MTSLCQISHDDVFSLSDCSKFQLVVKDAVFDNEYLSQLLSATKIISAQEGILTQSKIGTKGTTLLGSEALRGDLTCWITPDLCRDLSLSAMKSFVQSMMKLLKPFHQELGLVADYSVQFALYPGDGRGYVRHMDYSKKNNLNTRGRKLTAILYLNEEWEGGQLRVHLPCDAHIPTAVSSVAAVVTKGNILDNQDLKDGVLVASPSSSASAGYMDIDPVMGRLVIFRSDVIEHEVLPCYTDRRALTFWISADYPSPTEQLSCPAESIKTQPADAFMASHSSEQSEAAVSPHTTQFEVSTTTHVDSKSDITPTEIIHNKHQNEEGRGSSHSKIPSPRVPLYVDPTATPYSLPQHHWDKKTIFVSIASYCDSECGPTVQDLFRHASMPLRVCVGVAWQGKMTGDFLGESEIRGKSFAAVSPATSSRSSSSSCSSSSSSSTTPPSSSQSPENEDDWSRALRSNVRTAFIPSHQASGPIWARGVAFSLWRGETYYLQIDSHMRFRPGWDRYLIWQLEKLREEEEKKEVVGEVEEAQESKEAVRNIEPVSVHSDCLLELSASRQREKKRERKRERKKPVLTTYPLGYELPDIIPDDTRPTLLMPSHFDSNGMLRQTGKIIAFSNSQRRDTCIRSPLWASGFSFSDSSLLVECPYDPRLSFLFFGEESSMAARFYTSGYDFFAPPEAVLYHLWTRTHRSEFFQDAVGTVKGAAASSSGGKIAEDSDKKAIENSEEILRKLEVQDMRKASEERVRLLLSVSVRDNDGNKSKSKGEGEGISIGVDEDRDSPSYECPVEKRYGLGTDRTLQDFELMCGVSFSSLSVRDRVLPEGVRFLSDDLSGVFNALSQSLSFSGVGATLSSNGAEEQTVEVGRESVIQTECAGVGAGSSSVLRSMGSAAGDPGCEASNKALVALSLVQSYLTKR